MDFELPALPFKKNALEPHISEQQLSFHYEKHHQAYMTNLKNLVEGTELANKSLEEIIRESANNAEKIGIFNNAAQVWNHSFYWNSLSPNGGGEPRSSLGDKIKQDFGSFEKFVELFKQAGVGQFGSGWAWLVLDSNGSLKVTKTPNADLPMIHGQKALLTCDVWEHAYYLHYQNRRPDYVSAFWNVINWDEVANNLKKAK